MNRPFRIAPRNLVPSDLHRLIQQHLTNLNCSISNIENLYQLSPEGILLYYCSLYGTDPELIRQKNANDDRTKLARLKIIDALSKQFDWKQEKIADFVGRKEGGFVHRALIEILDLKSKGAWPSEPVESQS